VPEREGEGKEEGGKRYLIERLSLQGEEESKRAEVPRVANLSERKGRGNKRPLGLAKKRKILVRPDKGKSGGRPLPLVSEKKKTARRKEEKVSPVLVKFSARESGEKGEKNAFVQWTLGKQLVGRREKRSWDIGRGEKEGRRSCQKSIGQVKKKRRYRSLRPIGGKELMSYTTKLTLCERRRQGE